MTTFQILTSSESNEYYTPARYTDAARLVMGGIDIDPASCEIAQGWIKAAICYDQTEDGFQKDWHGRLWLNPPYGQASLAKNNYGAQSDESGFSR